MLFFLLTELTIEWEIIDDQNPDRQILLVRPSVIFLLTILVPYTDGPNPLVKLFNGGMYVRVNLDDIWYENIKFIK